MTLSDLLNEFNIVIDTDEGLNELRSLILGLAVRGKLVPQGPNDEPASEFLKKIEAEKKRLYEEGEISKPKRLKSLTSDQIPFSIPENWTWTKLELTGITQTGTTPKTSIKEYYGDSIPFIGPGDISNGVIDYNNRGLSEKGLEVGRLIEKGSILMVCIGGSIGKSHLVDRDVSCNQQINTITPLSGVDSYYSLVCLISDFFQNLISEKATGSATPILNRTKWGNFPFPLPPLAEQHRIVQRIESLFAEVDELEAKLNRQTKLDEKLQLAVNADLQQAPDAEASKSAWTFITSNFDTLYHTPEAIDNLKKNILNEAVRGRLVPQDPNDEPASELLNKIEAEKQRLYDEGEIRKPKNLPPVKEEGVPFEIPGSWEWCRFEDSINELKGGYAYKSGKMIKNSDNQVIRLGNVKNEGLQHDRNPAFITDEYASDTEDYKLEENDILITMTGTREKKDYCFTAVVRNEDLEDRKLYLNQRVGLFKLSDFSDVELYNHFLKSDSLLEGLFESATGTANQANISMKSISNLLFPVPPLEEQHRIVHRIEELFAICDRFKAQLEQRKKVNERLMKGLVSEVLEGV